MRGLGRDRQGDCYAAQGNLLTGPEVVDAMAGSFEASSGKALADRLMDGLDAAEAAGGDRRGKQSAALVVEQAGAAATSSSGSTAWSTCASTTTLSSSRSYGGCS